jgi:hypothetical protein
VRAQARTGPPNRRRARIGDVGKRDPVHLRITGRKGQDRWHRARVSHLADSSIGTPPQLRVRGIDEPSDQIRTDLRGINGEASITA